MTSFNKRRRTAVLFEQSGRKDPLIQRDRRSVVTNKMASALEVHVPYGHPNHRDRANSH